MRDLDSVGDERSGLDTEQVRLTVPLERAGRRLVRTGARGSIGAALGLMVISLVGCSGGGTGPSEPPLQPDAHVRQPLHVFASGVFGPLMDQIEPMFERDNPSFDLIVTFGKAHAPLDTDQDLQEMIGDGAQLDVFLAGDMAQVSQISREPITVVPWVGNRLVLVRRRGSKLRLIDLSSGTCEVAVALERTPLGRASRHVLESRGLWSEVSGRVGQFDEGDAIARRIASPALQPALGIVFASTVRTSEHPIEVAAKLGAAEDGVEHVIAIWTERGGRFAAWLESRGAQQIAQRAGFVVLGAGDAAPGRGR
jgi:ABC-type molybdate transport system substrate-binding protein